MIRAEAEKLDRPAVADLGSAGGVLTTSLKDIASVIYCVDSSDGMLAEVDAGGCVRPQLGDVADSGLPDESIDLVVCARVIEYLFWPDRLADEIRRIARPGATYFVTFPADRGETPPGDGSPDNRIRRYFTAEAIERWASRVGAGRLVGVQYDAAEPKDQAAEGRYRELDRSSPPGVHPDELGLHRPGCREGKRLTRLRDPEGASPVGGRPGAIVTHSAARWSGAWSPAASR